MKILSLNHLLLLMCFWIFPAVLMADNWPMNTMKAGCDIHFEYRLLNTKPNHPTILLKKEADLPFPRLGLNKSDKSDFFKYSTDSKDGLHLFCNERCGLKENDFGDQFRKIFPLKVDNQVIVELNKDAIPKLEVAKISVKVLRKRESRYVTNSSEYLIETSLGYNSHIDDEPYYNNTRQIWWNDKLGVFTVLIDENSVYVMQSTSCLPKGSLLITKDERIKKWGTPKK